MVQLTTPQPCRHASPTVKAKKLGYLIFERPDLDNAERFLKDFGLHTVSKTAEQLFMRAADSAPFCYHVIRSDKTRFIGFGLVVNAERDLLTLKQVDGASEIFNAEYPGGGLAIRLTDPSGFVVEVICEQQTAAPLAHRNALPLNYDTKQARVNTTQRAPVEAPEVLRLGHVVIEVADFQETCAWYTKHFGFIPSDVQVLPDGSPAVVFMRLDLGDTPADHHTLAIAQGFMPTYSHSAYEVIDADAVGMGQRVLRERGWKHAWGIGRHILGSQIFDYWQDPWGAKHEHYCDGDLFTADVPLGVHEVSREAMSQWGASMPTSFTKPKITCAAIVRLVHHLRHSPDLSLKKLITLAKIFG